MANNLLKIILKTFIILFFKLSTNIYALELNQINYSYNYNFKFKKLPQELQVKIVNFLFNIQPNHNQEQIKKLKNILNNLASINKHFYRTITPEATNYIIKHISRKNRIFLSQAALILRTNKASKFIKKSIKNSLIFQQELNKLLISKIVQDSTSDIRFLLRSGADINAKNNKDQTPLMWAFSANTNCTYRTIKLLLKHPDTDINAHDQYGNTALDYAIALNSAELNQNISIVKLLLDHPKININAHDNHSNTALTTAAKLNDKSIVQLLLSYHKININIQNDDGYTALDYAKKRGFKKITKLLESFNN